MKLIPQQKLKKKFKAIKKKFTKKSFLDSITAGMTKSERSRTGKSKTWRKPSAKQMTKSEKSRTGKKMTYVKKKSLTEKRRDRIEGGVKASYRKLSTLRDLK